MSVRRKIVAIYLILAALTAGAWLLALATFHTYPALVGAALLAYTFGLRHAVDADHIAAIDNATRKLMAQRQRPVAVGFFFSLGHSTIVIALSAAIACAAPALRRALPELTGFGAVAGSLLSALFLYVIAAINLVVLAGVVRAFRAARSGRAFDAAAVENALLARGAIGRLCGPLLRLVSRSWHLYPLGLLFGLGFDTATEVGLLGIAAIEAGHGLPVAAIMVFPLLFTAGMTMLDTTDGILMLGAYGWASVKPARKLSYNLTITLVSVVVALLVGSIEVLSVLHAQLDLHGAFGALPGGLVDHFGALGIAIVGIFLGAWALAALAYRVRGDVEVREAA